MKHGVGPRKERLTLSALTNLNTHSDPFVRYFAGEIDYTATLTVGNPSSVSCIDAGVTHDGITEVIVNGKSLGVKWYGDRVFPLGNE